jgi:hypothetical protein
MKTFAEILDALAVKLGGMTAVAAALSLPFTTVASWKARDSVPSSYWPPLIDLAQKAKVRGLSFKRLSELAAAQSGRRARSRAA